MVFSFSISLWLFFSSSATIFGVRNETTAGKGLRGEGRVLFLDHRVRSTLTNLVVVEVYGGENLTTLRAGKRNYEREI